MALRKGFQREKLYVRIPISAARQNTRILEDTTYATSLEEAGGEYPHQVILYDGSMEEVFYRSSIMLSDIDKTPVGWVYTSFNHKTLAIHEYR